MKASTQPDHDRAVAEVPRASGQPHRTTRGRKPTAPTPIRNAATVMGVERSGRIFIAGPSPPHEAAASTIAPAPATEPRGGERMARAGATTPRRGPPPGRL